MSADEYQVDGSHYKDMGVEPWEVMEMTVSHDEFVGYLKCSILKYVMRSGRKVGADHDDEKAAHYMQKLREVLGYEYE